MKSMAKLKAYLDRPRYSRGEWILRLLKYLEPTESQGYRQAEVQVQFDGSIIRISVEPALYAFEIELTKEELAELRGRP